MFITIEAFLPETKLIIHSIPVQFSLSYLSKLRAFIPRNVIIVSISKGIDSNSLELMCDIIPKGLGRTNQPLAFLSGPSFAVSNEWTPIWLKIGRSDRRSAYCSCCGQFWSSCRNCFCTINELRLAERSNFGCPIPVFESIPLEMWLVSFLEELWYFLWSFPA